jgi:hypothetical protein
MESLTINYNPRNPLANSIVDMIKVANVFKIEEPKTKNIYNEKFVDELLASKNSKGVKIEDADLWK